MLHESEIVDADIDDEAIEVQQFHDVAVGLGPTKLVHVDTMLHVDMPSIELVMHA